MYFNEYRGFESHSLRQNKINSLQIVLYPGEHSYPLESKTQVMPLKKLLKEELPVLDRDHPCRQNGLKRTSADYCRGGAISI